MPGLPARFVAAVIDVAVVRRLVAVPFPQWAKLSIGLAMPLGWIIRPFAMAMR